MSVTLNHTGSIDGPYRVALSTTNVTDIAGPFNGPSKVASIALANVHASTTYFCKLYYHNGTSSLLWGIYNVPAESTTIVDDFPLPLIAGHKLQAQAEAIDVITVTAILALQPK